MPWNPNKRYPSYLFFPTLSATAYSRRVFLRAGGKRKNVNAQDKGIGDVSYTRQNALYNDHCSPVTSAGRTDERQEDARTCMYFREYFSPRENRAIHVNKIKFIQIASLYFQATSRKLMFRNSLLERPIYLGTSISIQLVCSSIICDEIAFVVVKTS